MTMALSEQTAPPDHGGVRRRITISTILGTIVLVFVAFSTLPLARGSRRLGRRRRWLGQVQAGEVPGWLITPLTAALADEVGELPPLFHESAEEPVAAILARQVRGVERGAYRTSTELLPVATLTQKDLERRCARRSMISKVC